MTPLDPPADPGLVADDLGVRYFGRREPALANVSFAAAPGEIVGVAGRTGAGKSTLALAAAGFIPRVVRAKIEGSVRVNGLTVTSAPASAVAGQVGIVFSTPANQLSASKLTVREELAFGLENLGVPRQQMDGTIDGVLDRLGIAHLADREPFALSGGEQQRVAIASIVAMGTSVLLLDEPTAQLDPAGRRTVAEMLSQLSAGGTTVLCVEHDASVLATAHRCLVLQAGRAIAVAPPAVALGSAVLGPLGLRPPTVISLAELAGVPEGRRFDEPAIAAALHTAPLSRLAHWAPPDVAPDSGDLATSRAGGTVSVRDLVHRYEGGLTAVRDVNLTIGPGEAVAIVGQNGSGKTTLVKHFNGLLRPDEGVVRVGGVDIRDAPVSTVARTVGFVFQNPDEQLFNRTVEREVAFGPRNLGIPAAAAQTLVDRAIRAAGLGAVRGTNPYDLGSSIRKLVALASVLAMEPSIVVLDEPTTGQDAEGVQRIGSIIRSLRAAARTVVAITHDMEFAAEHFSRVVVMRQGEVIADGAPAEVLDGRNAALLATTGLEPPIAARIGARLGLGSTPTATALVEALRLRGTPGEP